MRTMEPAKPEEPSQIGTVAPFPVLVHHINDGTQALFSISDSTSRAVSMPEISGRYFPTSYGWILVLGPPPAWEMFLCVRNLFYCYWAGLLGRHMGQA
jgi:hypothetical protein